jgi:uncharacterized protein with FMN-binding domain
MRRSSMIMGGTVLGAAAVMVIPRPSTPRQVAIAGNAGAIKAGHAKQSSGQPATTAAQTTTTTAAPKPKPKPAAPATKTVVGSVATDQYGQLQVKLTVANNRITRVGFASFIANDGHSMQIDQYAAPVLIRETIAAQSAHIQGVSGATYTSMAYQQSLQAAIDKAGLKA